MFRKLVLFLFVSVILMSSVSASLTDGLVSYWKLDETSGTNADDAHGSNDGTANDVRVFTSEVTGIINTGVDFSQGYDRIVVSSPLGGDLNPTNSVSLQAWFNTSTFIAGDYLAEKARGFDNLQGDYGLQILTNGRIRSIIRISGGSAVLVDSSSTGLDDSELHQAVLTFNGTSGDLKVYVDGNLNGTINTAGSLGENAHDFAIGNLQDDRDGSWNSWPWKGIIDEVGIWSRTLNSIEIEDLYNSGDGFAYPFVADTCSCPGAGNNWEIDMSDYCNITSDCDLTTGKLSFTGSGITRINATINTTDLGDPGTNGILKILLNCWIWDY